MENYLVRVFLLVILPFSLLFLVLWVMHRTGPRRTRAWPRSQTLKQEDIDFWKGHWKDLPTSTLLERQENPEDYSREALEAIRQLLDERGHVRH